MRLAITSHALPVVHSFPDSFPSSRLLQLLLSIEALKQIVLAGAVC